MKASIDKEALLGGDRRSLARALTEVENDTPVGRELLDATFIHSGKAHLVGVTGSPGAGKSSLVNQLALHIRQSQAVTAPHVGIIAVDPSSPFTGGAILGDRVRMRDLSGDEGVFIRSMASRGTLGGLARKTSAMVQVLDAAGFEIIMIETVGAGQSEVDIARLAHTTIVVESPGMGDDIQAIKAGILEIADILVVNKADQPLADLTMRTLQANLDLAHPHSSVLREYIHHRPSAFKPLKIEPNQIKSDERWIPPILATVATQGEGLGPLWEAILAHKKYLEAHNLWQQQEAVRLQEELNDLLLQEFAFKWRASVDDSRIESVLSGLLARQFSPHQAMEKLLSGFELTSKQAEKS